MSLNGLLESGRRSLRITEAAMQTAGNNVANAGTAGYHRRRMEVTSMNVGTRGVTMRSPLGSSTGAGTMIQGYTRARNTLLETSSWKAQSGLGGANESVRMGAALEAVLDPESAGSINGTLGKFWSAWTDATNNPTDAGARTTLLGQAGAVADSFKALSGQLADLEQEASNSLDSSVSAANDLIGQIAQLNQQISQARVSGAPDLDAEDARDEAIRSLSSLAPVRVSTADDGSLTITMQGMAVVQGRDVIVLEHSGPPTSPDHKISFKGTSVSFSPGDGLSTGRLGAGLTAVTTTFPNARQVLDSLANKLVTTVNAAHVGGYGLDGATGRPFFDPAGTTASSLSVAVTDPSQVALSGAADSPGDTSVGRAIAGMQEAFTKDALELSTGNGRSLSRARASADAQAGMSGHLDALAEGLSAVSIDEEMTNLLQYQKAYAASAKVLQTVQDMFDTILSL